MTVHCLPIPTDTHPDAILEIAKGNLTTAIIVGEHRDGTLWVSSSNVTLMNIYYLLQRASKYIIELEPK